jgi:hypothetical protein
MVLLPYVALIACLRVPYSHCGIRGDGSCHACQSLHHATASIRQARVVSHTAAHATMNGSCFMHPSLLVQGWMKSNTRLIVNVSHGMVLLPCVTAGLQASMRA